jgi:hypothetical protein
MPGPQGGCELRELRAPRESLPIPAVAIRRARGRHPFPSNGRKLTAAIAVLLVVASVGCCFFEAHDHDTGNLCLNIIAAGVIASSLMALTPVGRATPIGLPTALSALHSVLVPPPRLV